MGLRTTGRLWPIQLTADGAYLRQAMQCCSTKAPVRRRAHPSPQSYSQKFSYIKGLPVFEHEIDRAAELMGQDGKRFSLAMLMHQLFAEFSSRLVAL